MTLIADFKHGCRCMDCDEPILYGEPYSRRLVGFQDDLPVSEIICWRCARPEPSP